MMCNAAMTDGASANNCSISRVIGDETFCRLDRFSRRVPTIIRSKHDNRAATVKNRATKKVAAKL